MSFRDEQLEVVAGLYEASLRRQWDEWGRAKWRQTPRCSGMTATEIEYEGQEFIRTSIEHFRENWRKDCQ